ncbi:hypothetical protein L7F22_033380 [Adiantum nelumboides]|nr:hypothetical protein [Adiantum nelumboides]
MVASLLTHLALQCFSLSPLFINTFLSFLTAVLNGLSAAWMAYKQWHSEGWVNLSNNDLLMHKPWEGAHFLLCSYIGFLFFDSFIILLSNLHAKLPFNLLHHAIVLIGFSTILLYNAGFNYLILTLICEVHSMFAHLRCLLRMLGLRKDGTLLVKGEWGLHWAAYMTTRLSLHLLICIKAVLNWSTIAVIMDWPMVQWPVFVVSVLGINIWNVTVGLDLYKAFLREVILAGKSLKAA